MLNTHREPHYNVNKFVAYSCSYTVVSITMQLKGLVHPKINVVKMYDFLSSRVAVLNLLTQRPLIVQQPKYSKPLNIGKDIFSCVSSVVKTVLLFFFVLFFFSNFVHRNWE